MEQISYIQKNPELQILIEQVEKDVTAKYEKVIGDLRGRKVNAHKEDGAICAQVDNVVNEWKWTTRVTGVCAIVASGAFLRLAACILGTKLHFTPVPSPLGISNEDAKLVLEGVLLISSLACVALSMKSANLLLKMSRLSANLGILTSTAEQQQKEILESIQSKDARKIKAAGKSLLDEKTNLQLSGLASIYQAEQESDLGKQQANLLMALGSFKMANYDIPKLKFKPEQLNVESFNIPLLTDIVSAA